MLNLGISIVMVFVGLWIIRRTSHRSRRMASEKQNQDQSIYRVQMQELNALRADKERLSRRVLTLEQHRELDLQVAQDAIRRENRAKEALRAVLKRNRCTPEQIEHVLNTVDGEKSHDGC